jgi:hypothetical protein
MEKKKAMCVTTGRFYTDGSLTSFKMIILDGHRDDGHTEVFIERGESNAVFTKSEQYESFADCVLIEDGLSVVGQV